MEEAEKIREMNRSILRFSKECNDSNEVAMILDSIGNAAGPVFGDQHSVNIEGDSDMYHLLRTSPLRSLVISHNHPGLSYFSYDDLGIFVQYPSIKLMMVVTNQGKCWYLRKKKSFDDTDATLEYVSIVSDKKAANERKAVELLIARLYNAIERSR